MIIDDPLLLVISIPSSFVFGFVRAPSDTDPHIGSVGDMGVDVGDKVGVGVNVNVGVKVDV